MKIAAIYVLYNPDVELLSRSLAITSTQVDHIYLIDNTKKGYSESNFLNNGAISYHPLGENMGIAYALNKGCKLAMADGFDWALTMDQDSIIPSNMIPDYLSALRLLVNEKAAMLVPKINVNAQDSKTAEHKITKVLTSYTSGSFMSLKAFSAIGGFKNELFIDSVDFEYCLNLNEHGYGIYQVGTVILKHQLGRTKEYKICNKHLFYVTHHNYIRRYYMTRNGIWLRKQYGSRYPELHKKGHGILVSAFKILFFEEDKFKKIRSMYRGYIDYKKGIWGKYRYQ